MNLTWEIAAAICAIIALFGGAGVKWITSTVEQEAKARAASSAAILNNQNDLKDDLKQLNEGFEKRVDRLEQQSREFRSGASIDAGFDHAKTNTRMMVDAVKTLTEKNANAIDTMRDRVTRVETKHEATAIAVDEVKRELKDARHEINDRFDQQALLARSQFEQLCQSIRDIREVKPKTVI